MAFKYLAASRNDGKTIFNVGASENAAIALRQSIEIHSYRTGAIECDHGA